MIAIVLVQYLEITKMEKIINKDIPAPSVMPVDRCGSLRFVLEMLRLAKVPFRELSIYAVLFLFGDKFINKIMCVIRRRL